MTQEPQAPAKPTVNSSFSLKSPGLQLGVDSTSLGEFKQCPRKYQLSIIEGWQQRDTSVHLEFGIWLHHARELYESLRSKELGHEPALRAVLKAVLTWTWDPALGRGWWSDHPTKNRKTLIQTVVWYLDAVAKDDPLQTLQLANGRPAVELSFRFDSGLSSRKGETIVLCGHLDRVASLGGEMFVVDIKTTGGSLGAYFMAGFSPDNQMSLYTVAGRVVYELPVAGVIIDGIQVGAGFARFQRGPVLRTPQQLDEWLEDVSWWIRQMEACADAQHWPMNDKACGLYGGCQFRGVCSRTPGARQQWLQAAFVQRVWDPLKPRGGEAP